ncbi:MAG: membrane protein insertion efficiency factor YidD [Kineosporiaceae bacterium]
MNRRLLWIARFTWNVPRNVLIGFIRLWRAVLSPLYGPTCKYYPSCSAYGLDAVRAHGAVQGAALTLWRIVRCNPWSDGGIDDVPAGRPRRFSWTTPWPLPPAPADAGPLEASERSEGTATCPHPHDPTPPTRRAA